MKQAQLVWTLAAVVLLFMAAGALSAPKSRFHRIHADNPAELRELFVYSEEWMPLVSAHRGGPVPGYPENCIETFEHTLEHAYSMLEIDLRYSKDGHIVLHHDTTLDRTTTGTGPVDSLTLAELKKLKLIDREGTITDYRIPTLDEAIEWACGNTILILDKKDVLVETCVRKIREHKAQAHVMIMVYKIEDIQAVYDLDPNIMMEVMVGDRDRFKQFDQSGVPWNRVIPFISHQPPKDPGLIQMIHAKGASCMAGSSRYLDRDLKAMGKPSPELRASYHKLLQGGIDIIETDLPIQVSQLAFKNISSPSKKAKFFNAPE